MLLTRERDESRAIVISASARIPGSAGMIFE